METTWKTLASTVKLLLKFAFSDQPLTRTRNQQFLTRTPRLNLEVCREFYSRESFQLLFLFYPEELGNVKRWLNLHTTRTIAVENVGGGENSNHVLTIATDEAVLIFLYR